MNIIKFNNNIYRYESLWRRKKNTSIYDTENNLLPFPKPRDKWQNQNTFLEKLKATELNMRRKNRFIKYDPKEYKSCLICKQKNISKGLYDVNRIRWESGLYHYIFKHNIKPSSEFIDFIFRHELKSEALTKRQRSIGKIHGRIVTRNNKKYLKLDKNQIMIMDALMKHGSYRWYSDKKKRDVFRYSEHAGLLDFDNNGLEKIVISGNTTRVDKHDDDIFLPKNMIDMLDYEYIFHTHPATPKPGGRADAGILYELPSPSDLFHFMDHHNDGKTQGSIVITAEGMYIIRQSKPSINKIKINENKFLKEIRPIYINGQSDEIEKYGTKFTANIFYSKIAQDKTLINKFNKILNKFKLHIDYYPRIKDYKGRWIIDTIYLPVYVIEIGKR